MNLEYSGSIVFLIIGLIHNISAGKPLVINTWNFQEAAKEGIIIFIQFIKIVLPY